LWFPTALNKTTFEYIIGTLDMSLEAKIKEAMKAK